MYVTYCTGIEVEHVFILPAIYVFSVIYVIGALCLGFATPGTYNKPAIAAMHGPLSLVRFGD